jgi:hypothetical protein
MPDGVRTLPGLSEQSDDVEATAFAPEPCLGALNLCYAHSIPREVLLSKDSPDRLCEAAWVFLLRPRTIGGLPRQQT